MKINLWSMSNDIFYRVAYLRKTKNSTIPTGHIHVGFNKDKDPHGNLADNRIKMLEDIEYIIKKFNNII